MLSGLLRPDEVENLTGVALPEDEDYDTIAGLMLKSLGRIPRVGDEASVEVATEDESHEGTAPSQVAQLRVARMDGLRVDRITMTLVVQDASDGTD